MRAKSRHDLARRSDARPQPEVCNCLALRQASRHVTQFYDRLLASRGLRTTQFSILIRLRLAGPMTINALAKALVMNRTTLGRNILPLEREGLIDVVSGRADRRSKILRLTKAGAARCARPARAGPKRRQNLRRHSAAGAPQGYVLCSRPSPRPISAPCPPAPQTEPIAPRRPITAYRGP